MLARSRFWLFLVAFLGAVHLGHSLKCYKCNGCETTSTLKETCRDVDPETQISACMTQKIQTGSSTEAMTIKKCTVYDKDKRFECQSLPSGDTIGCSICHDDFCNTGSTVTSSFLLCLSIFVIIFVQKLVL